MSYFPPFQPEDSGDRKPRIRTLPIQRGEIPIRMLVPNMITLIGLCAGLTAVRMGFEQRFDIAVFAILFAAFMDGVDGRAARLLDASSRFGAELDSLADFVNFGVAPALILYFWGLHGDIKSIGWIVVLIFSLCMVLRLARFNVSLEAPDEPHWKSNYFVGVPAPAGALIALLPVYLDLLGVPYVKEAVPVILLYLLGVSFLLVSHVPTFSGKLLGEKVSREHVAPLFVLAILFAALLFTFPFLVLTLLVVGYLLFIPISVQRYKVHLIKDAKGEGSEDEPNIHTFESTGKKKRRWRRRGAWRFRFKRKHNEDLRSGDE